MSEPRVSIHGLQVGAPLHDFVRDELLTGLAMSPSGFWAKTAAIIAEFAPHNARLLAERERLQAEIDNWHAAGDLSTHDAQAYRDFLQRIGYIIPSAGPAQIDTASVDPEIASIAGPQLVVPVTNARYALNAVNARWGSLYDALYGTDALGEHPSAGSYDPARGARVIAWSRRFLDDAVPLVGSPHADVLRYAVVDGQAVAECVDGRTTGLADPARFDAYVGRPDDPGSVFLRHHGLGIEIVIDRDHPIGSNDPAGVADVRLEAAVTTIMDCEDSVATVDAADKTHAYRNWLGLMRRTLTAPMAKHGSTFERTMSTDRIVTKPDGSTASLRARALMLVRNVGHLMTTPAVLDADSNEVPEGILDAVFTVAGAAHDLQQPAEQRNSPAGSIYVVKPKMHGPAEVAFANDLFGAVEDLFGLPRHTVKIGIMDEERRTTVNLAECIRAARSRVAFINTGFLDRTGDEIHTSMRAGPMVRKADMKRQRWITAYEDWNVDVGLSCGLAGRAQIGKGMWAAPDLMHDMLDQKLAHPAAGANCAWVPSPTAATLHATHYHRVDVHERQRELTAALDGGRPRATLDDLLTIPVVSGPIPWNDDEIQAELDNNLQGILGYVVRWVDQGVGCSKVPDINDIALMEDRATCRISSQHVANWLAHGVVRTDQVVTSMRRMARTVDEQNANDPTYVPMAPGYDGSAFTAACDLVLRGSSQPSGYTEPILHRHRLAHKSHVAT